MNNMAKVKRLFNNFGGTRVKVPQSLRSSDLYLRAVTAIFIYLNLHVMRVTDEKFKITNAEVAYWRKIHDLNVPRKETPRLIYFVRTVNGKEARHGKW